MPAQKVEVNTPYPCPPHVMVAALVTLVPPLPTPRTIGILYALLHVDHIFIGGGNAVNVSIQLPDNVTPVSNDAGVEGEAMLWRRNPPNR